MSELPPTPPTSQDFPDHWGFYLLQTINRLVDKIDQVSREQQRTADALRQDIHALDVKVEQKLEALDAKFEQKLEALDAKVEQKLQALDAKVEQKFEALNAKFEHKINDLDAKINTIDVKFDQKLGSLQYWYWGTLLVIVMGFVTVILTRP